MFPIDRDELPIKHYPLSFKDRRMQFSVVIMPKEIVIISD